MRRLSPDTLAALPAEVARPIYDRESQKVGIVHFDAHYDATDSGFGLNLTHGNPVRRLIEQVRRTPSRRIDMLPLP